MAKPITEEEYDRRIAVHGKVVRIEPFKGTNTKILHTCLKHNQSHLASPKNLLKGRSLICCLLDTESKRLTEQEYDQRIAAHGKAVRVEPLKGTVTKIKHLCLTHNEVHLATPSLVLNGHGLSCCRPGVVAHKKAKEEYDEKLAKIGKIVRLEDYKGNETKILHKCTAHNFEQLVTPHQVLSGTGLNCCRRFNKRNQKAKEEFDNRLAKIGRVVRLGEYVNKRTKIDFLCLIHHQVHSTLPSQVIRGHGLACCKGNNCNTLSHIISKPQPPGETCLYLYELLNHPGYFKIGISNRLSKRAKDPEYGDFITSWHTNSRLEAYCVEQAALRDVLIRRSCPDDLRTQNWPGYTEVISCSEDTAIDVIQFYWDEVDRLGPYQFALDYLNPTEEERQLLAVLN
jgi:hypothetical protein